MKKIVALLLVLVLMAALSLSVIVKALPRFLQETLQLHSAALFAAPVAVDVPQLDRGNRSVHWANWRIEGAEGSVLPLRIAALSLSLPVGWRPDWSSANLLPAVMSLETVTVEGVELTYDIDREQLVLRSEDALPVSYRVQQQAIAAAVQADVASQRFLVQQLEVKNIRVRGYSVRNPQQDRDFTVSDMTFSRLGEGGAGVSAPAIVETVSRALLGEVQRQALALHVIELPREEDPTVARKRQSAETQQESVDDSRKEDSGAKRAAKSVGQAIDKGWKGLQKIFD